MTDIAKTSLLVLTPTALAGSRVYYDPAIWQQAVAKLRDTQWAGFAAARNKIPGQLIPYLCNGLLHNSPRSMKPSVF